MNLAEQAAMIFRQCTHYNMLTGEGYVQRTPADPSSLMERPYVLLQGPQAFLIMRKLDASHRVIRQRVGYDDDGSSLLYTWDPRNGPEITTNDRKPDEHQPCTLGVGCDETGVCYAEAHGYPEQCGRNQT